MKKKALIFHPIIAPYRIDFFNVFSDHFDATVCLFLRNMISQVFDYNKIAGRFRFSPVYLVKKEKGWFSWLMSQWRLITKEKPNVVFVSEYGVNTMLVIAHKFLTMSNYKIIAITDDSYDMISRDVHFTSEHKYAVRLLTPFIDEVINVEPRVAELFQRKYNKGIYFPIICDDEVAIERQGRSLPLSIEYVNKYDLLNKKIILFVGRLVAIKNVQFALKSFIDAAFEDAIFVVVGDGPDRCAIEALAQNRTDIIVIGRLEGDALYAWYNIANVFVLPSILEPFGAVTNEALVAGCKAMVSSCAGSNSLVKDGINGYVFNPKNEDEFIGKLRLLLNAAEPLKQPVLVRKSQMIMTFEENMSRVLSKIDNMI